MARVMDREMTILIKLGGSLITDKTEARSFRSDRVSRIAKQVIQLRDLIPDARIVIGHGSGSFGHVEAQKYNTVKGVYTAEERQGFSHVGAVAAELSLLVQNEFLAAGLPMLRFQPSSTLVSRDRRIESFDSRALSLALDQRFIPLIHGDIALDLRIGGTIISTESIFAHLAQPLGVDQIILLGEVAGVLNKNGELVPQITPGSFANVQSALAGSHGVDVTGGMSQKVKTMIDLARMHPSLNVIIADGRRDNLLRDLLVAGCHIGTRICVGGDSA